VPQSLVLTHQQEPRNAWHYYRMSRFFADASGKESDFPAYVFIEPTYYRTDQNDDHPPHSTVRAQSLIASVYNALRANEALWNSTLLVVVYDEHGGFYDHVSPPGAVPPDDFREEYTFDRLGLRVPAILVSPWVDQGVETKVFDHTSILKYLIDKWNLDGLTARVAAATSIGAALRAPRTPREDTPTSIEVPSVSLTRMAKSLEEITPDVRLNENQKALIAFSHFLESQLPAPAKPSMMMAAAPGPFGEDLLVEERVERFIEQQRVVAAVRGAAEATAAAL